MRTNENKRKRKFISCLEGSCDPTTLSLLQIVHKNVCRINSKVKGMQKQLCLIATKFCDIKDEINKIQASMGDSDDEEHE